MVTFVCPSCYVSTVKGVFDLSVREPIVAIKRSEINRSYSNYLDYYDIYTDELIIECHIRAAPAPIIYWYKDAIEMNICGRLRTTHEGSTYQLCVSHPDINDSGKYVCQAENPAAKVEFGHYVYFEGKDSHLHVSGIFHANQRKPADDGLARLEQIMAALKAEGGGEPREEKKKKKAAAAAKGKEGEEGKKGVVKGGKGGLATKKKLCFAANLKDRTVFIGQTLKLYVTVIGPEPNIKWLKNECNIVYTPRVKNFTKESYACIEIYDVCQDDAGEYKCVAKNAAGEIITSTRVTVHTGEQSDAQAPIFLLPLRGIMEWESD